MEAEAQSSAAVGSSGGMAISISSGCQDLSLSDCCNLVCTLSGDGQSGSESEHRSRSAKKLLGLIAFCVLVMTVEVVGGVKANSLAILADAAHMLTDVAGLAISLFATWASGWVPTSRHSFGFRRLEVLGALLSLQLIWLISEFLIYEAVHRILHKAETVNGKLMFLIAAFGFLINFVMVTLLGHDHHHHPHGSCKHGDHHHGHGGEDEELCALAKGGEQQDAEHETHTPAVSSEKQPGILNINLRGAYLHIVADLLQSIGVMIAGAIIWAVPSLLVVDLISTLLFSVLVVVTTIPLLRDIFSVLMERVPSEIDLSRLEDGLKRIKGVCGVHDLHVWSITVGKFVMSCHVVPEPGFRSSELLNRIRDYCKRTHRIDHVTIQIE